MIAVNGVALQQAVLVVAVVAAVAVLVGFEVFCLRDLVRADGVRTLTKPIWAVLCLFTIPLGGMLYLVFGRTIR